MKHPVVAIVIIAMAFLMTLLACQPITGKPETCWHVRCQMGSIQVDEYVAKGPYVNHKVRFISQQGMWVEITDSCVVREYACAENPIPDNS